MDLKLSLVFLTGTTLLLVMLLLAYRKKNRDEAIRYHFWSQLMMLLGYVFGIVRVFSGLDVFSFFNSVPIILSSSLESLALLFLCDSLTPRSRRMLIIHTVIALLGYSISFLVTQNPLVRMTALAAGVSLILIGPGIKVLRIRDDSALRPLLGGMFILLIAANVYRIIDALQLGKSFVIFGPSPGEYVIVASLYASAIVTGVGVILLSKERSDVRLVRLADYDGPTRALNRGAFISTMKNAIEEASYHNKAFSMVLVDLEGLNEINNSQGFATGDRIIADTSESLQSTVGASGFVGRVSGDEFMLFLKEIDSSQLQDKLQAIRDDVVAKLPHDLPCTISIGATHYDFPAGRDLQYETIYTVCADALKTAKRHGSNEMVIAPA